MNVFPWYPLLGLAIFNMWLLIFVFLTVMTLEHKHTPNIRIYLWTLSPFLLLPVAWCVLVIQPFSIGLVNYLWACVFLGMGLFYVSRCLKLDIPVFKWIGCFVGFILLELILKASRSRGLWRSEWHEKMSFDVSHALTLIIPMAMAVVWIFILWRHVRSKHAAGIAAE